MAEQVEYIFCINTGRAGSFYLKSLFDHVSGCCSFHEPEPQGNGKPMREYLNGKAGPVRELAREKAKNVEQAKEEFDVYVETNHWFIKGFGWFLPEYLSADKIGIVVLKRDKDKTAESLLGIGCSPLTQMGRNAIITPDAQKTILQPPKLFLSPRASYYLACAARLVWGGADRLCKTIFQSNIPSLKPLKRYEMECLRWYVEETAEQTAKYRERFPDMKYYDVNITDLNSPEEVGKMLSFFGLSSERSITEVIGKPNNRTDRNNQRENEEEKEDSGLTFAEVREKKRLARYARNNVRIKDARVDEGEIRGQLVNSGEKDIKKIKITVCPASNRTKLCHKKEIGKGMNTAEDCFLPAYGELPFTIDVSSTSYPAGDNLTLQITAIQENASFFNIAGNRYKVMSSR
jgi:hypothetical protein